MNSARLAEKRIVPILRWIHKATEAELAKKPRGSDRTDCS
jgi:hypothetical protein